MKILRNLTIIIFMVCFTGMIGMGSADWTVDAGVIDGLPLQPWNTIAPSHFYRDDTHYMVIGRDFSGIDYGSAWSGALWQNEPSIIVGLPGINQPYPTVFEMDDTWYMIIGNDALPRPQGFQWDGSNWQSYPTIIGGLTTEVHSAPDVFCRDDTYYCILGMGGADPVAFRGFEWTGAAWLQNSSIVSGLPGSAHEYTPAVFQMDTTWVLIAGRNDGGPVGYSWNGVSWISAPDIIAGIPLDASQRPTVFWVESSQRWFYVAGLGVNYVGCLGDELWLPPYEEPEPTHTPTETTTNPPVSAHGNQEPPYIPPLEEDESTILVMIKDVFLQASITQFSLFIIFSYIGAFLATMICNDNKGKGKDTEPIISIVALYGTLGWILPLFVAFLGVSLIIGNWTSIIFLITGFTLTCIFNRQ